MKQGKHTKCGENKSLLVFHYAKEPPIWGTWGEWEECSEPCGGGQQERTRECEDAECPLENGECPGDDTQTQECNTDCCPGAIFYCLK